MIFHIKLRLPLSEMSFSSVGLLSLCTGNTGTDLVKTFNFNLSFLILILIQQRFLHLEPNLNCQILNI